MRELLTQVVQTPEQQQWLRKLLGFDFTITYRPGKDKSPADGLSRIEDASLNAIQAVTRPVIALLDTLRSFFITDPDARTMVQKVQAADPDFLDYEFRDGLLFFKQRIWIPKSAALIPLLIAKFHASPIGGHTGIQ